MGGEPGPGSETCYGRVGEQTDMQPNRVSKFVVKVWLTVWCLIVLGNGWGGSWGEFQGVYSFHDRTLLKDTALVIAYEVPSSYSGGQSRLGITDGSIKEIKRGAITRIEKGNTTLTRHRIEGDTIQKIWHTN